MMMMLVPIHQRSASQNLVSYSLLTVDGELKVPPQYNGQNMNELIMHSQVPSELVEHLASNTFFDSAQMFSGEELTTTHMGNLEIKSKGNAKTITKKLEIFFLLYQWGMYYLQLYPEKAAGYLEYLAYLTKYGEPFHAQGLLKLDFALRCQHVKHPSWGWDQNNPCIHHLCDLMSKDSSLIKEGAVVNRYPQRKKTSNPAPYLQYQSPLQALPQNQNYSAY